MIEKGAGARDYPAVAGLAGAMPLTATVIALAALSMGGLPPFFGFIGKELIYEATTPRPGLARDRHRRGDRRQRADGRLRRDGRAPAVLLRAAAQPEGPARRPGLGARDRPGDPGRRSGSSSGSRRC